MDASKSKPAARLLSFVAVCLSLMSFMALTACHKQDATSSATSSAAPTNTKTPPLTAAKKYQLEWNLQTTVGAYEQMGKAGRKWDKPAKAALTEFARLKTGVVALDEPARQIIATNLEAALQAGCEDPLVLYLHARYCLNDVGPTAAACTDELVKAATAMKNQMYPPVRKFYASFRAVNQITKFYGRTNVPPELQPFMQGNLALPNLEALVENKATPPEEAFEACDELLEMNRGNKQFAMLYEPMGKSMFRNWPNASVSWLLKGMAYHTMAWLARGGGYADAVPAEGWKGFRDDLAIAQEALEKAWELDPTDERSAVRMIGVEQGQGQGRERMELWFHRAMDLNPKCHDACLNKLLYLYPQWYGSREEMLAFGRECVTNDKWAGSVPLILADAHQACASFLPDPDARAAYWRRPDVWPDIHAAYERFFQLNPDAVGYHHNYAMFAYHCEQWDELNRQLELLGPVNYAYFGGQEAFDRMVTEAKVYAAKAGAKK